MRITVSLKLIFFLISVYVLFFLSSSILIYALQRQQIITLLTQKITSIQKDVQVKDNSWNLSRYNSDPHLIGNYPLYFFTTDGIVLDRRAPINGFLDTSNFNLLLRYIHPQTVTAITNQTRRMVSQAILWEGKPVAVISVSYFNPGQAILPAIDKELTQNLKYIASKVTVKKGTPDVHAVDARYISYNVAFVIVDKFNTILKKTNNVNSINRIPNVIDPSYIKPYLKNSQTMTIQDHATKEFFLMKSAQIVNVTNEPMGIIIVGQSLSPTSQLLFQYLLWESGGGIIFLIIFFLVFKYFWKFIPLSLNRSTVSFDEQKGILIIANRQINIPYATNQFYLLQALFHKPSKRWETDELLERFGEEQTNDNWRKVYDTMIKINKKVSQISSMKLILNQNKTYRLNPDISLH